MTARACDQDRLLALAAGQLGADQTLAVLDHVEVCAHCSAELDFLADLSAAAESAQQAVPAASQGNGHRTRRGAAPAVPAVSIWLPPALLAASLLLALGLAWRGSADLPAGLPALQAAPWVGVTLRSTDPSLRDDFQRAMEPYDQRLWPEAAWRLDAFLAGHAQHGPARFYRGVVHEMQGQWDAAADSYAALGAEPTTLAAHASWRLACLRVRQGQVDLARPLLLRLVAPAGTHAAQAGRLLEGLGHASRSAPEAGGPQGHR